MSNILYGVSTSFALSQSRFLQSKSNENVSTQTVHHNTITGKDNTVIEVEETHVNTTTDSSDVAMDIDATLFAMDTKTNDVIEREPTFADLFDVMDDDTSESETHNSNKDNDSSTSDFDFSDDEPENKKVRFSDDDNNIEMSPKANDDVALPSDGTNEISLNARNPSDRSMWCAILICTVYIASNRQVSSCLGYRSTVVLAMYLIIYLFELQGKMLWFPSFISKFISAQSVYPQIGTVVGLLEALNYVVPHVPWSVNTLITLQYFQQFFAFYRKNATQVILNYLSILYY
jgi:hypothetical protein